MAEEGTRGLNGRAPALIPAPASLVGGPPRICLWVDADVEGVTPPTCQGVGCPQIYADVGRAFGGGAVVSTGWIGRLDLRCGAWPRSFLSRAH